MPAFYNNNVVRSKIVRTFVTLDEVWDYKTGKFTLLKEDGNYLIEKPGAPYSITLWKIRLNGGLTAKTKCKNAKKNNLDTLIMTD